MAGTIIVDRIESDASYASNINVAAQVTFSNTVAFAGSTSGTTTVVAAAVAGTTTLTLPATSGTVLQSGTTVTEAQGGTGTTVGYYGFKNRIINGAMVISQRNAGASVTVNDNPAVGLYPTDRFLVQGTTSAGVYTAQQSTSTPPAGFTNFLRMTTTTASASPAAGAVYVMSQIIEGYNIADFGFGAAGASTITVSFWVRSSLTGTFSGSLRNGTAFNRSYPFTYAISSANTWEQKSVTIAGDTSGTWSTGNTGGLVLAWDIGGGSTYASTANTWQTGNYTAVTGSTRLISTLSATLDITGVQLEKGSTATSFDYRPYGTELLLCQRYYAKTFNQTTAPAQNTGYAGTLMAVGTGGKLVANWNYPATMRAIPTLTTFSPNDATSNWYSAAGPTSIASLSGAGTTSAYIYDRDGNASNPYQYWIQATASAEL